MASAITTSSATEIATNTTVCESASQKTSSRNSRT